MAPAGFAGFAAGFCIRIGALGAIGFVTAFEAAPFGATGFVFSRLKKPNIFFLP
jgi:hypothetical protein